MKEEKSCNNCKHHYMNHQKCDARPCLQGSKWEPVEAEKELRDELIKFWEWVNDGEISNYATRLQLIDEYLTNK